MSDFTTGAARRALFRQDRRLEVGALGPALWRVFRQQPWSFYALSLIPLLVSFGLSGFAGFIKFGHKGSDLSLYVSLVSYLVQLAFQSATIHGAARIAGGSRFGLGAAVAVGCRRLAAYFVASLLAGLVIGLGFLLLIVPGIIAFCVYGLAAPASTIETIGPLRALQRSAEITRGNRWRVLGAALLYVLVPVLVILVVIGIIIAVVAAKHPPALAVLSVLVGVLAYPLALALWTIFFAVLFIELRAVKEGGGPGEAVSRVFD